MTLSTKHASRRKPVITVEESGKREAILKAAAKAFLAKGYVGTSMDLVAVASGAGRRTVYNQFASKKALFDATVELLWQDLRMDQTVKDIGVERSPSEGLTIIGNAIANFWGPRAIAFTRMVAAETVNFPELGRSLFSSGRDPARHAVVQYFSELHNSKTLTINDLDLAAAQFVGLIIEPLALWFRVIAGGTTPTKERRKQVVEEAVHIFLCRYKSTIEE